MRQALKLLRLAPRLLGAFVTGAVVRFVRRVLRRPPRIWHGFGAMFLTASHVAADRLAGFPARSVAIHARLRNYEIVRASEFDAVYADDGPADEAHWRSLADLLRHGDIWYTHFESIFFRHDQPAMNSLVMSVIALAGIRIIVTPHGGDILHRHRAVTRYDWIGRAQLDYPNWDLEAQAEVVKARIGVFCRYAHFVIGGDHTLVGMLPRHDILFPSVTMDCTALTPSSAEPNAVPRVIHAPNHRHVKGTAYLLAAVERLRARGIPVELVLIEGVARHEALRIYETADIVADQFIIGSWGVFAAEGMSLGKPVMTYLSQETLGDPLWNHPIANTTPENLEKVLAVLLLVPDLRVRLGSAARESIERYQSIVPMADLFGRIYRHVWWKTPLQLDETAMFSPERKPRAFTEDPADPAFWPVDVSDLMEPLRAALARVS